MSLGFWVIKINIQLLCGAECANELNKNQPPVLFLDILILFKRWMVFRKSSLVWHLISLLCSHGLGALKHNELRLESE